MPITTHRSVHNRSPRPLTGCTIGSPNRAPTPDRGAQSGPQAQPDPIRGCTIESPNQPPDPAQGAQSPIQFGQQTPHRVHNRQTLECSPALTPVTTGPHALGAHGPPEPTDRGERNGWPRERNRTGGLCGALRGPSCVHGNAIAHGQVAAPHSQDLKSQIIPMHFATLRGTWGLSSTLVSYQWGLR